jgi:hypothetical protein
VNVASPGEAVAAVRAGLGDFAAGVRDVAAGVRDVAAGVREVAAGARAAAAGARGAPIASNDAGISRAADPDASAAPPLTPGTAGVPAWESGTAPDRRGARDRVVRRSTGPSVGLMTRAYVSVIASHAAPYRFMLKHRCFMRMVCLKTSSRMRPERRRAVRSGQAALVALSRLTYCRPGRPTIRASPHSVQPHSRQSPSGTSGQLAGSA